MNQTEFAHAGAPSQCELILERLQQSAGEEVGLPDLYLASGALAVATRISNLRKRGINITQRSERHKDGSIHSFYKLQQP